MLCVCMCVCVCHKLLAAAVVVAAGVAGGGGGDIIQAGLVLQQGYIPGEHYTNLTQNSHLNSAFCGGRGLTASSYILYDCTTSGHTGTVEYICNAHTVYIHFYTIYLFIHDVLKVLETHIIHYWYSPFQ